MMPERVSKVRIIIPKTYLEKTISALYSLKALHIETHQKSEIETGEPLRQAEKISELLVITRSVASNLKIKLSEQTIRKLSLTDIEQQVKTAQKDVSSRLDRIKALEEKIKVCTSQFAELKTLLLLGIDPESIQDYKSIAFFIGKVKDPASLERKISKLTDRFEFYNNGKMVGVFIDAEKKSLLSEILTTEDFSEYPITLKGLKGNLNEHISSISSAKMKAEAEKALAERELIRLGQRWKEPIIAAERTLSEEIEKAQSPLRFGATKNIIMITGYVPEKNSNALRQKVDLVTSGKNHVFEEHPHEHDKVPVKLNNPGPAKPFEFLIRLRGLPLYGELDPTLPVFLTFPLFFGFMLGDIGYGLLTLALMLFLMTKAKRDARSLLTAMAISAAVSIVFGLIFGEFFGAEEFMGHEIPHLISRSHQINELLMAALAFGVIHVNLGLIFGFINEARHHGMTTAILEKGSWFLIELGSPFLLGKLGIISVPSLILYGSATLFTIGLLMLMIAELKHDSTGPIKAIVESITIFSNILSYARLMAVGLASVQLALIVNMFAEEFFHQGGFMVLAGIITLLVGHTVNILLGLLGSFLHSLRLEYVEFFTKFFKGGAEPYKPFGEKE